MDEYILTVGNARFLLSLEECMEVAKMLNSASRVETTWIKDVPAERSHVRKPPSLSAAWVTPMTAILSMEIEANMKTTEAK